MSPLDLDALLRSRVREVPDFPEPGIGFKDITPLLADHTAFAGVIDAIVGHHGRGTIDKVAGIEARGFILAAAVAYHFGAGFVPMRKAGKLPSATYAEVLLPGVRRGHDRGASGRVCPWRAGAAGR